MAQLRFLRGLEAQLPKTATDGYFYLTSDTHRLYVGQGEALVPVNEGVLTVASIEALPESAHAGDFYYATAENVLCVYNGSQFIQINPDTGATAIEVVGEGNAVTVASYDPATRKLTLTKGETFATKAQLDAVSGSVEAAKPEVYQVTSDSTDITELTNGITGKAGDVLIATNTSGIKSAYHYDTEDGWIACDGNVDASTVILKDDITMAGNYTQVGNLSKAQNGTAKFATAGKSVADALTEIFSKRLQPDDPINPAITLTFSQAKAYEVGTTVTPTYSASLSAGSYTYGPATGVTASSWSITDGTTTKDTASGSFDSFVVADDTNYKITASATYGDGAIAKDNLGSDSNPIKQIKGATISKTSGAVTGYRSFFYGVVNTSTADAPLTSTIIRGLTNGGAYTASKTFTLNGNANAKRIVVAIPSNSTRAGVKAVILTSAMNTPVTDSYVKTVAAVQVEGVGGATAVDYDVWVYEPAAIDAGEVHQITLA